MSAVRPGLMNSGRFPLRRRKKKPDSFIRQVWERRIAIQPIMLNAAASFVSADKLNQPEPPQVFVGPTNIRDHAFQRSDGERVTEGMIGHHDAAAVGAPVDPMTAPRPRKSETVRLERPDE